MTVDVADLYLYILSTTAHKRFHLFRETPFPGRVPPSGTGETRHLCTAAAACLFYLFIGTHTSHPQHSSHIDFW